MSNDLAGKALYPLADLIAAAAFPLAQIIAPAQYAALFSRFYYSDVDAYVEDDQLITDVELFCEGMLGFPVPGLDGFHLVFNSPAPGWTRLRASLVRGDDPACMIYAASVALQVPETILKNSAASGPAAITVSSDIVLSSAGISFVNFAGASLGPARLLNTDIVIAATGVRPILSVDDAEDAELDSLDFRGLEISRLSVEVPLAFLKLADQGTFTCELIGARIDNTGFTGAVQVEAGGLLSSITGQYLTLPFEFRQFRLDIEQNHFNAFSITIAIRLAALESASTENWLRLNFGLDNNHRVVSAALEAPLVLSLGRADSKLTVESLTLAGQHQDDGLTAQGSASGTLQLPNGTIALQNAALTFAHSTSATRLAIDVTGLKLGDLGVVQTARLAIAVSHDEASETSRLESVTVETVLTWADIRQRIGLDQLPPEFPLPPDDSAISAFVDWQNDGKVVLRLAAAVADLSSLWRFVAEEFRPEVRNARFMLAITYANGAAFDNATASGAFNGDLAVELELRAPHLPQVPGSELFVVNHADSARWIKARLRSGLRTGANGASEPYLELEVLEPLALDINLPGLAQTEPPIHIAIAAVNFDLAGASGAANGRLALAGNFQLRPIDPAKSALPVPPALAAHMAKLFKAVGLTDSTGSAAFDLQFAGGRCATSVACCFDDAGIQLDLFDMIAGLARGMSAPSGIDGGANAIDLDIEFDLRLREIKLALGSIEAGGPQQSQFSFSLGFDGSFAGVQLENCEFKLSDQEFAFGLGRLAVPIALPHFPLSLSRLNELKATSGQWDYENRWLQATEPQLTGAISNLKIEIDSLKAHIEQASGAAQFALKAALRRKRNEWFDNSARKFLTEAIFAVHQLVGAPNRAAYQSLVEAYMALMDATLHQFSFDTKLDFVLRDVRLVLPFQNPSDVRVEGGAQLEGFKPDDPLAPLGAMVFKVGLSADYVYFNVEGGEPIALPAFGYYRNQAGVEEAKVCLRLNHARIGYGYTKNSLVVAFAGELKLAPPLVDDLNTADAVGIGVRLPERSRLGFKLDLIPIVLGEVDFLLPVFDFDIDLRKEYSPGIVASDTCAPFWDGLQLVAPNIIRQDFKRLRFAPFFGTLVAPNYNLSFDLMLGDAHNGLTYVCNDYFVIVAAAPYTVIPLLTDGTPFFNNLCVNVRLAGFGVNFDLQRPFPSFSPLALFEIFGLLADPLMPIDPDGALANTIRVSIEHARITLPSALVRMFPEQGALLTREVNHTVNLGTLITIVQAIAGGVGEMLKQAQQTASDFGQWMEQVKKQPPDFSPGALLALLPPELRRFDFDGSFVGFDASAAFVLLTPAEVAQAFAQRDKPLVETKPRLVLDERFADPNLSGWQVQPPSARSSWQIERGALAHSGSPAASFVLSANQYDDVSCTSVLRADGENALGVVFGYQDENNHYRFALNRRARSCELLKVRGAQSTVLQQLRQDTEARRSYTVTVRIESATPALGSGRVRLRVAVDGRDRLDVQDSNNPFKAGRLGLFCDANAAARFASMQIHRLGARRAPILGEYADPAWLTSYRPDFSKPTTPLYDPSDPANSLLKSAPFDAFETATVAALPVPAAGASGVLVGAEVKLLEDQRFGFLGYLFTDGTFNLISALDLEPLRLSVAGLTVQLPLQVSGRLNLTGRAAGARSFAQVGATVYGSWQPLPGIVEVNAGSKTNPIELMLHTGGRFAIHGSGGLKLFGGAAVVNGSVDISHTHCFVTGALDYKPNFQIGGQRLIELNLASAGRVGPANAFELSGSGTLKILGKKFSQASGKLSNNGIEVEARLDSGAWNWNGIDLKECQMTLSGKIDLSQSGAPSFLLAGDSKIRLFGAANSKARAEISGRGGIRAQGGELSQFVEGSLYWQGREWLGGRLELGTEQIALQGRTAFALDLTPAELPTGIQLANLFFRVDLAGGFRLTKTGGLRHCSLDVDWSLALKMPGIEQQFPIAMQKKRFAYNAPQSATPNTVDLLPLLNVGGALFVPLDKLTLPIPVITADQFTQFYGYWDTLAQTADLTYKKVSINNSGSSSDPRFPSAVGKTGDLNIAAAIANAFGLPAPPVKINVPTFGITDWKYIKFSDEDLDLPDIKMFRVGTSVPASVPANQKFELFKLPTRFNASFADGANMLKPLQFSLTVGWQDGKLGLIVARGNSKKFTAFEDMFD